MTSEARTISASLLSREWRDGPHGLEVTLWGRTSEGPVAVHARTEAVCFVPRRFAGPLSPAARREEKSLLSLQGEPVDALYFAQQRELVAERERLREGVGIVLESDLKPSDRFVMERLVTGAFSAHGVPTYERGVLTLRDAKVKAAVLRLPLRVVSLDLETDGIDGPIIAAALATKDEAAALVVTERPLASARAVRDERALLEALMVELERLDPDVITGWNVVEFDLSVLERRAREHRLSARFGRKGGLLRIIPGERTQPSIARIEGRVAIDGIAALKSATYSFERYGLEDVGQELLGRGKTIHGTKAERIAEITRLHREDPDALAAYNLEDARLALAIVEHARLVEFMQARAELTGLPLDRQGGSVAAFDHLYLPRLHRAGFVAPDVGLEVEAEQSPGGQVFESVPGLHRMVLSFDFRSLYPSIIRTFAIDPLALALHLRALTGEPIEGAFVPGFEGAAFHRESAVLPGIVEKLHEARLAAQRDADEALSRAIKILMNSLYGVLGTPGCRFFDPRLASSITRRGHEIIERARAHFEAEGMRVLYGDTDSLFVATDDRGLDQAAALALGARLAREVNVALAQWITATYGIESKLELRFVELFESFLLPTMRGTDRGSKKRYAGAVRRSDGTLSIVTRGLEAVRTDWSPLARDMQVELFRRVFSGEPFEEWLRSLRHELLLGHLDEKLVYRKRLRRELDQYGRSERSGEGRAAAVPPHVRAARLLDDPDLDTVEYVITVRGPEPTSLRTSPLDYTHYLEKQLAPAADVVLGCLGTSFARIAGEQLVLF